MNVVKVDSKDHRYATLKKGFNMRWPSDEGATVIYVCSTEEEVIAAANEALSNGQRITVRSGGHCYEGFVSNQKVPNVSNDKKLAIIDLSLMTGLLFSEEKNIESKWDVHQTKGKYKFSALTGNQNWDGYVNLYKLANRTIPGGSCYSVGSGGHVCGGGYGLLSRMHGLTVDWLSAVDIAVPVKENGKTILKPLHVNKNSDPQLFKACRGAGGGNFGIILKYYYEELPVAPQSVYLITLAYKWDELQTKENFADFMKAYWQWFSDNDGDWNSKLPEKSNGGLFSLLKLHHKSSGNDIQIIVQYTGSDGTVGSHNNKPFIDFVNAMNTAAKGKLVVSDAISYVHGVSSPLSGNEPYLEFDSVSSGGLPSGTRQMDWLYATQTVNGSGDTQYGKYKSAYQKDNFTDKVIDSLWKNLNTDGGNGKLSQALVQIDSYGGSINHGIMKNNVLLDVKKECAVYQRKSLLKWQLQVYWQDKADEGVCLKWIKDIFTECFVDGKPYEDRNSAFEGCYINYPDVDMKYKDGKIDKDWMSLYYGDLAMELLDVKKKYDPDNIFYHEMSIPRV